MASNCDYYFELQVDGQRTVFSLTQNDRGADQQYQLQLQQQTTSCQKLKNIKASTGQ